MVAAVSKPETTPLFSVVDAHLGSQLMLVLCSWSPADSFRRLFGIECTRHDRIPIQTWNLATGVTGIWAACAWRCVWPLCKLQTRMAASVLCRVRGGRPLGRTCTTFFEVVRRMRFLVRRPPRTRPSSYVGSDWRFPKRKCVFHTLRTVASEYNLTLHVYYGSGSCMCLQLGCDCHCRVHWKMLTNDTRTSALPQRRWQFATWSPRASMNRYWK